MTEEQIGTKRKHRRWNVFELGALYTDQGSAPCVIGNISAKGALVSCEIELEVGQIVTFELEDFGKVQAEVRHISSTEAGLFLMLDAERQEAFVALMNSMEKENE